MNVNEPLVFVCTGGLVIRVLALYSGDPSSRPAEVYRFYSGKIVENN